MGWNTLEQAVSGTETGTLLLSNAEKGFWYLLDKRDRRGRKAFTAQRTGGDGEPQAVFLKAAKEYELNQIERERAIFEELNKHAPNHPFIRPIDSFRDDDTGLECLVFPYVQSLSLQQLALGKGLFLPFVSAIVRSMADDLAVAHGIGIYHGDIKPDNALIPYEGSAPTREQLEKDVLGIKITDFGIAHCDRIGRLAKTGFFCGTLSYSPIEIISELDNTSKTDTYQLGLLAMELLVGKPPFSSKDRRETFDLIQLLDYPPEFALLSQTVPPPVEKAIRAASNPHPRHRLSSPQEFAAALEAACNLKPKPRRSLITTVKNLLR